MVRMGPTMGPRLGPTLGPNPAAGDPLVGFSTTMITVSFEDYLEFPTDLDVAQVETGSGPFRVTTDGVLPTEYAVDTDYWFIKLTSSTGWLAASEADALANNRIVLTDAGTGNHTLTYVG